MKLSEVYCTGSPDFAKVYRELEKAGKIQGGLSSCTNHDDRQFGPNETENDIYWCFADPPDDYASSGRKEITPSELSKMWLGYDCLAPLTKSNTYCKGGEELARVLKVCSEKGVPGSYPSYSQVIDCAVQVSEAIYGSGIGYSSKMELYSKDGRREINAHQFSEIWLGYDCLVQKPTDIPVKAKIYCQGCDAFLFVLQELAKQSDRLFIGEKKVRLFADIRQWADPTCFCGVNPDPNDYICWSRHESEFISAGYQKVTPNEFSIAWLGYDCLDGKVKETVSTSVEEYPVEDEPHEIECHDEPLIGSLLLPKSFKPKIIL